MENSRRLTLPPSGGSVNFDNLDGIAPPVLLNRTFLTLYGVSRHRREPAYDDLVTMTPSFS